MNPLDQKFRRELSEMETPLGSHLTFEKVMEKRNAGSSILWGKFAAALLVISTVGISAWSWLGNAQPANQIVIQKSNAQISNAEANKSLMDQSQKSTQHHSSPKVNTNSQNPAASALKINGQETMLISSQTENPYQMREATSHNFNQNQQEQNGQLNIPSQNDAYALGSNTTGDRDLQFEAKDHLIMPQMKMHSRLLTSYVANQRIWKADEDNTSLKPEFELLPSDGAHQKRKVNLEILSDHGFDALNTGKGTIESRKSFASHYQISWIHRLNKNIDLALGLGYGSINGTATDHFTENYQTTQVQIVPVIIKQPGLPDILIYRHDTSVSTHSVDRSVGLGFSMNKFYLPATVYRNFNLGSMQLRISAGLAPGLALVNDRIFSKNEYKTAVQQKLFTYDVRLGAGVMLPITGKMSFIAEPFVRYNRLTGNEFRNFSRTNYGLGFGVRYTLF